MRIPSLFLGVIAAMLITAAGPAAADAQVLFNNTNTGGVLNGGGSSVFVLNSPTTITQVQTYHWNFGRGSRPGSIELRSQNGRYSFPAAGSSGQGGAPNVNWVANFNVTVPAGTYAVVDSDPSTWSQNSLSQGRGFVIVRGFAAPSGISLGRPSVSLPPDQGRNTRFSPTLLYPIRSVPNQTINDTIGGVDPNDWYFIAVAGFNGLNRPSAVTIRLSTASPSVTLELYTESGSSPLATRPAAVGSPKVISASLMPGNYLIHVTSPGPLSSYSLNISVLTTQ
jgi:hypothetical protein